jgi:hypothetical protein
VVEVGAASVEVQTESAMLGVPGGVAGGSGDQEISGPGKKCLLLPPQSSNSTP